MGNLVSIGNASYPRGTTEKGLYQIIDLVYDPQLKVGDVIPFGFHAWIVLDVSDHENLKIRVVHEDSTRDDQQPRRAETTWRQVARPITAVPSIVTGHWNAKCPCGSRTYVGFLRIEHENVDCNLR